MSKVTIVARVTAKSEAIEAVQVELLKMIAPTRQEEGCIEYRLHQDLNDPALFLFYENWSNRECLERHLKSKHYLAYAAAVTELLADKAVLKMSEIG